ncbi:MAG TPA: alpha/beta hydrolase [Phycisphaerales bacterium]|nr:alpha/beta hydrolase [Phycisphaerales bacterium]
MLPLLALISIVLSRGHQAEVVPEPPMSSVPAVAVLTPGVGLGESVEPERWVGSIELPGMELGFAVRFEQGEDGSWSGYLDIPMQGLADGELSEVAYSDSAIGFVFEIPNQPEANWPRFSFEIDESGQSASGVLRQAGGEYPATLELDADGSADLMPRPQTPVRPLPYREESVVVPAGEHELAGTLTLPDEQQFGAGPYPAVVFISGSGPQDRDETILGHKPFFVISDALAKRGIAGLRCDDRGFGESTGDFAESTTLDFADDVRACISYLKGRDEIGRIGLIGHSEGAMIAPMVAAGNEDVGFVVLLAGPGVTGKEILVRQTHDITAQAGMDEASLEAQRELQTDLLDRVVAGAGEDELREVMMELIQIQLGDEDLPDDQVEAMIDQQIGMMTSPWMRTFLTVDPRPALREMTQPVLVLNGSLDLQVVADQNLPEIEKALAEAGNTDVTIVELEGLNHLFQPAQTGALDEYASIETTFDEAAMKRIGDWILEHVR